MFLEAVFTDLPVRYSNSPSGKGLETRKYGLPVDGDEGVEWTVTRAVALVPVSREEYELRMYSVCAKLDFLGLNLPKYEFCTSREPIKLSIWMAGPSLN